MSSEGTSSMPGRDARSSEDKQKREAHNICKALTLSASLVQALVLNHQASKEWIGKKSGLEVIVDLLLVSRYLSPSSQESSSPSTSSRPETTSSNTLTGLVLDTLLCILVPSPSLDGQQLESVEGVDPLRNFEEVQGLQAVVKILKRKGSGRGVRMKCLEFLYFYLLDETSPKFTGLPESAADIPISSLPSSPTQSSFGTPTSPRKLSVGEETQSHSTPSYPVSRNLHNRSQSQTIDSSLSTPSSSTPSPVPSTPFKKSHIRTSVHALESSRYEVCEPECEKNLLTSPRTSSTHIEHSQLESECRLEHAYQPPTPISRYGSSAYTFSSGSSGGTFSTSTIPNSRVTSAKIHSRSGSGASSHDGVRIQAGGAASGPSSRSVSGSSAASGFSITSEGSETSTAPSSVHSSPRKHSKVLSEEEDVTTEKEEERKRESQSRRRSGTPAKPRLTAGTGPGGIGLGRPGQQTPPLPPIPQPQPQAYLDFVPATPAPKHRRTRTADGPATPIPVPKLGVTNSTFAKTPAAAAGKMGVKMKKAGSESVIGVPSNSRRGETGRSGSGLVLGRTSSLNDVEDAERERAEREERERKKEDAFWDFEVQSPQKKSFFPDEGRPSSSSSPSSSQNQRPKQTRTTKEKTAILGTMLGNVDALVRSLEGVRLG
ncbi:hypothetical protein AAF712_002631 [Marasmius tenuissimus]|uniref:Uncharacterized protein n=1 Tax=Marasmius tenuissimus TaxID=585030 RepID=A0ABR3A832_9AGAR